MADYFRRSNVQTILDFGFTKFIPLAEAAAGPRLRISRHSVRTRTRSSATGSTSIRTTGAEGVRELRRCIDKAPGFIGFAVSGSGSGPPSDPTWIPFYELCIEASIPALIFVGTYRPGRRFAGRQRNPAR